MPIRLRDALRFMLYRRPPQRTKPRILADFFDEDWYCAQRPDAPAGLAALRHYLDVGAAAGTPPSAAAEAMLREGPGVACLPPPGLAPAGNRLARLRAFAEPGSKILEIGAAYAPIAPRRDGWRAFVLDNVDREGLLARYAAHPNIDRAAIEEVDFVCPDGDLAAAVPPEHWSSFDVIFLSHVFEHLPNPIAFLRGLQRLVRVGGKVIIAVPDQRACFDYFRPVATAGAWLDAYAGSASTQQRGRVYDFHTMSVAQRGLICWPWTKLRPEALALIGRTPGAAYAALYDADEPETGIDCHAWAFTPSVFALLLHECHALGLISLVPVEIGPCEGFEFFADLRLAFAPPINQADRLRLLEAATLERLDGARLLGGRRGAR